MKKQKVKVKQCEAVRFKTAYTESQQVMQHKLATLPINTRAVKLLSIHSLSRPQILTEGHDTPSGAVG